MKASSSLNSVMNCWKSAIVLVLSTPGCPFAFVLPEALLTEPPKTGTEMTDWSAQSNWIQLPWLVDSIRNTYTSVKAVHSFERRIEERGGREEGRRDAFSQFRGRKKRGRELGGLYESICRGYPSEIREQADTKI